MNHRPSSPETVPTVDLAREATFRIGATEVRPATLELVRAGRAATVEPKVMQVLVLLARRLGEVTSRDELVQACWAGRYVSEDSIHRTIFKLRKAGEELAGGDIVVETIPRVGYRLAVGEGASIREAVVLAQEAPVAAAGRRKVAIVAAAAGVLGLAAAIVFLMMRSDPAWEVESYQAIANSDAQEDSPALSRDGGFLAFALSPPGDAGLIGNSIAVRRLPDGDVQAITKGGYTYYAPAWSPGGDQIAYARVRQGQACEIVVQPFPTGLERVVGRCHGDWFFRKMSWSPDGRTLVYIDTSYSKPDRSRVVALDLTRGSIRPLTAPPKGAYGDGDSAVSPDGRRLAFQRGPLKGAYYLGGVSDIFVTDLRSGRVRQITQDGTSRGMTWTSDSRSLVYVSTRSGKAELWSESIDGKSKAQRLVVGLCEAGRLSSAGDQVAFESSCRASTIARLDAGGAQAITAGQRQDGWPIVSRDGTLAFLSGDAFKSIWLRRPGQIAQRLVALSQRTAEGLAWSPDGRSLALTARAQDGDRDAFVIDAASGLVRRLPSPGLSATGVAWDPGGRSIVFTGLDASGNRIWRQAVDGASRPRPISPSGWYAVGVGADGVYGLRAETPYAMRALANGVWRLGPDGRATLVADFEPVLGVEVIGRQVILSGDSLYMAKTAPDAPLIRQRLAGGPPRVVGRLPGAHLNFAVDPTNGGVVYTRLDAETADVGLIKLRRAR